MKTQKKLKFKRFPFYIHDPVTISVGNSHNVNEGQIIIRKGIVLQAIHDKIAYDGMIKIAVRIIGLK